jgi:sec-independent protein translocase protein TatA
MQFGIAELLIILVIVTLLFGVGRISKLGGELGHAIANFRDGLAKASDDNSKSSEA